MIILFMEKKGAAEKKKVALIGKYQNDVVNSSELSAVPEQTIWTDLPFEVRLERQLRSSGIPETIPTYFLTTLRPRNSSATLRLALRTSLALGARSYVTFAILDCFSAFSRARGDCLGSFALRDAAVEAAGVLKRTRKPFQTIFLMTFRPHNSSTTLRAAPQTTLAAGARRYVVFVIFDDFQLPAVPGELTQACSPPEEARERGLRSPHTANRVRGGLAWGEAGREGKPGRVRARWRVLPRQQTGLAYTSDTVSQRPRSQLQNPS